MSQKKIVITAVNAMSSIGANFDEHSANLPGKTVPCSVKSLGMHEFDQEVPCFRIENYEPKEILGKKGLRLKDWTTKLLLGTCETGFKETLESFDVDSRPGICVGTAFGSVQSIGDFLSDSIENGVNSVNPQLFANTVINSPTGYANIRYDIQTLSATVSTGFNAGLDAITYAHDRIFSGYNSALLAGGLDEVSYYTIIGMMRSGMYSKSGSMQPFGIESDGYIMGEGCALFMIESEESAKSRGAQIICEIAGIGTTFDFNEANAGYSTTGDGARRAMTNACDMAGISTADVSFVASSANGNKAGDTMELNAIRETFGDAPVAAYKIKTGECYGASPAINTACAIADMKQNRISGTNADYSVSEGLNIAVNTIENQTSEYVLVNSFSCEGNCSSLLLKNV